jgi:hypothetical protein
MSLRSGTILSTLFLNILKFRHSEVNDTALIAYTLLSNATMMLKMATQI